MQISISFLILVLGLISAVSCKLVPKMEANDKEKVTKGSPVREPPKKTWNQLW